jgi:hypothetical protein
VDSLNKIKITDMNEYDAQRILRENTLILEGRNDLILQNLDDGDIPPDLVMNFADEVADNAAEILYTLSITDDNVDLQTFVDTSPLFRNGGNGQ